MRSIITIILVLTCHSASVTGRNDMQWEQIGWIAPRHAKEIRASNWSVGAETMDRDWTIYNNWKSYLGPLGAKKARIQSGWAKTEKTTGVYDFAWLDAIIHDMNEQGVRPWVSLSYGNPIYPDGGGTSLNSAVPKTEEAMAGWKNYVKATVSRYKNDVDEWEVWNEPNYRIAPEDYANLFMATAEIIRTEQPTATIIAFAIGSGVDYKYVDKVMEIIQNQGKIHLIDQITHHRHIPIPERNDPELDLEKVVAKYNPSIKIRQGEGGCPSQRNEGYALSKYDWTETSQAKHISRRLLTDLGRDKESSCFTIMESRSTEEWNYKGLLKANPDSTVAYAKPAYYAFQHITSVFDDRLERIKQYRYSTDGAGESNISLYAYKNKTNDQVVTVWLNDKIPSDDNQKSLRDFTFYEGRFSRPVWVDMVSGEIYEIPSTSWSKNGDCYEFKQIPIYDSPILIADLSVLKIREKVTSLPFDFPDLTPPVFPDKHFDIRKYGAKKDNIAANTKAVRQAIEACVKNGGGKVIIPQGVWDIGPIHLKSNVNLHLEDGAELRFSQKFEDYLPVTLVQRGGVFCHTYSPFVYAHQCENIAVTGNGILNGQGQVWWPWAKRQPGMTQLWEMGKTGVPVDQRIFGTVEAGVRPPFVHFIDCKNVFMEGVTLIDGPSWNLHPVFCENMIIRNIKISAHGPNNDGIDPDGCKNMLIEDCDIDAGDDAICLKSGRDEEAWRNGRPCENIVIRRCITRAGHGGVVVGSEMSAGVRNILVEDCRFIGTQRGLRFKSYIGRGGIVENIWIRNITMSNIRGQAIEFDMQYDGEPIERDMKYGDIKHKTEHAPVFRDIRIENIVCDKSKVAIRLLGIPDDFLKELYFKDIQIYSERGIDAVHLNDIVFDNVKINK